MNANKKQCKDGRHYFDLGAKVCRCKKMKIKEMKNA